MRVRHATLFVAGQGEELVERRFTARRARLNGPPAKIQWGIERETRRGRRSDVVGGSERGGHPDAASRGGSKRSARGGEHRVLMIGQESQHAAETTTGSRPATRACA